jgi:hypothetical protein
MSISLYHCTRSFKFVNTCEEHDKYFVLSSQKILNNLSSTSKCKFIENH